MRYIPGIEERRSSLEWDSSVASTSTYKDNIFSVISDYYLKHITTHFFQFLVHLVFVELYGLGGVNFLIFNLIVEINI
jgi:hypothetical protein